MPRLQGVRRLQLTALSRASVACWALLLLALGAGCGGDGGGGGGGGNPMTPDPFSLSLAADPGAIGLFGAAELSIQARRTAGGAVDAGTEIVLTTSLGRLDSERLFTDEDGRASTFLRGTGAAGSANVTARLATTSVTATAQVGIGVGLVLEVRADPEVITGGDVARITASLTDDGNPVTGTQINLTTTRGRLETPSPRTDSLGNAVSRLLPEGDVGTAVITASTQGVPQATAEVQIGNALMVSLTASPAGIPATGSSFITATVERFDGSPAGARIPVRLSTSLGRLDDTDPRTNGSGIATTNLRGDGRSGMAVITARVDGAPVPATVEVNLGGSAILTLRANPTTIPANGASVLSAVLTDVGGAPIGGEPVTFTTTLGIMENDRPTTSGQGQANTRLLARGVKGIARVTAEVPSRSASATVEVEIE